MAMNKTTVTAEGPTGKKQGQVFRFPSREFITVHERGKKERRSSDRIFWAAATWANTSRERRSHVKDSSTADKKNIGGGRSSDKRLQEGERGWGKTE